MCFIVISQWCPCVLDMHIGIGVGTMGAMGAGAPLCFLIITWLGSILYTLIILPLPIDL